MRALFVELPAFSRFRSTYLDDEAFRLLYDKDEADDLTAKERSALKQMIKAELEARER